MIIAIDGPAGSGKSTLAKLLSKRINFLYLDTGAIYRAVTLKLFSAGIASDENDSIKEVLTSTLIDFKRGMVSIDGIVVEDKIRTSEISNRTSDYSSNELIRNFVTNVQRQIAADSNVVIEGRDIGTVVFPHAEFKFYLTASVEERAKRRYKDLKNTENYSYEEILEDIKKRDYNDSSRDIAPLKQADDAILINTDNLTSDEVCSKIINLIRNSKYDL